ncbi:hypothetical protein [Streptomyces sp. NPDC020747]|uniref:hypothetical protein n=1 Tax=Streptomyces sp. NPDC020747 TaxID=3365086 RepID=UPI0037AA3C33
MTFAAVLALAVVLAIGRQHRLPAAIAAGCVLVIMGTPQEFINAVLAAVPGITGV